MQFGMHAMIISENKVYLGTLLATAGVGLMSKEGEPRFVLPLLAGTAALSYLWLSKYTPQAKLYQVKAILDDVAKNNELAKRYVEKKEEIIKEVPENNNQCSNCRKMERKVFINEKLDKWIIELYPTEPGVNSFPLVSAVNQLVVVNEDTKTATNLLDAVLLYIPEDNKKKGDSLWDQHVNLNTRAQVFSTNIKKSRSRIDRMPRYRDKELPAFEKAEEKRKKREIAEKNAQSKAKIANAATVTADAQQKKSNAVVSLFNLKWWELILRLLGINN